MYVLSTDVPDDIEPGPRGPWSPLDGWVTDENAMGGRQMTMTFQVRFRPGDPISVSPDGVHWASDVITSNNIEQANARAAFLMSELFAGRWV